MAVVVTDIEFPQEGGSKCIAYNWTDETCNSKVTGTYEEGDGYDHFDITENYVDEVLQNEISSITITCSAATSVRHDAYICPEIVVDGGPRQKCERYIHVFQEAGCGCSSLQVQYFQTPTSQGEDISSNISAPTYITLSNQTGTTSAWIGVKGGKCMDKTVTLSNSTDFAFSTGDTFVSIDVKEESSTKNCSTDVTLVFQMQGAEQPCSTKFYITLSYQYFPQ